LTPATDLTVNYTKPHYFFKKEVYDNRVYNGFGKPDAGAELVFGPNITDWPAMPALSENLLLKAAAVIHDPVTTTDELIPSGETSSFRSNPLGLAEFTLSRKDPLYVSRAKAIHKAEQARLNGEDPAMAYTELKEIIGTIRKKFDVTDQNTGIGSFVYAIKPGDGSAREQAASCQKVLGGYANSAREYATKRYRSNLMNWGMLPFILEEDVPFGLEDYVFIPAVRKAVEEAQAEIPAFVVKSDGLTAFTLKLSDMTEDERKIILAGCLINYYREV
jgi:aconitate hydratase